MNKKIFLILIVAILVMGLLIAALVHFSSSTNTKISTSFTSHELVYAVGDSINYEDRTLGVRSRLWDFGDGSTSTDKKGVHVYTQAGDYPLKLTVNNKISDTYHFTITLKSQLDTAIPHIEVSTTSAYVNDPIKFTTNVSGASSYTWTFGDGVTKESKDPSITYSYKNAGPETVELQTNNHANEGTIDIVIHARPVTGGVVEKPSKKFINDLFQEIADKGEAGFKDAYPKILKYTSGNPSIPVIGSTYAPNPNEQLNDYVTALELSQGNNLKVNVINVHFDVNGYIDTINVTDK